MTTPQTTTDTPVPFWCSSKVQLLCLVAVLIAGAWIRIASLQSVTLRSPDEGHYTESANILRTDGAAGTTTLMQLMRQNPIGSRSPSRAGYLFLLARVMQWTGHSNASAGADLSCAASILSLCLLALLAWRRLSPAVALAATVLYSVAPVSLITARRAWQESLIELLTIAFLLVGSEIIAGKRRIAGFVLFAALFAFAVTVKESAVLSGLLCAAWVVIQLYRRNERRALLIFIAIVVAAGLCAIAWLASLLGGFSVLLQTSRLSATSMSTDAYSLAYEAGPWWSLVACFWVLSPVALLLALLACGDALANLRNLTPQRRAVLALLVFVLAFAVPAMFLPHHLNLRYISATFGPAYLLAGIGLTRLIAMLQLILHAPAAAFVGIAAAIVLIGAALDYSSFRSDFSGDTMMDLSSRMVLEAAYPSGATQPPALVPANAQAASGQLSAAQWLDISVAYSQSKQPEKSIEAAQRALAIDASSAAAWNNIAAGYEDLHQWDSAIAAAQQALKLQPDMQLARNNLSWALSQKALQAK